MIRDLMAERLLYRFGQVDQVPHQIKWLMDNGACYIARETVLFGRSIGLEICTTRPYNPESNGMAEAFVNTLKRD
jgi:putative transposase